MVAWKDDSAALHNSKLIVAMVGSENGFADVVFVH